MTEEELQQAITSIADSAQRIALVLETVLDILEDDINLEAEDG